MERKLATIQKIIEVHPIVNADNLERAVIKGWNVVVKKGEFQAGDLCVYCEIDSLMPERPEFEFLESKKYRIKTTKFRGQVSQGIAFPLSILPESIKHIRFKGSTPLNAKFNENEVLFEGCQSFQECKMLFQEYNFQ